MMRKFIAMAFLAMVANATAADAQPYYEKTQTETLTKWRETASKTQAGQPLVALLDRCNANIKQNPRSKEAYYQRGYLRCALQRTSRSNRSYLPSTS
jgi:hypothetical protein